jgi:hypothetical protein
MRGEQHRIAGIVNPLPPHHRALPKKRNFPLSVNARFFGIAND